MVFGKAVFVKLWYWAKAGSKTEAPAVPLFLVTPASIQIQDSVCCQQPNTVPALCARSFFLTCFLDFLNFISNLFQFWVFKSFCDRSCPSLCPLSIGHVLMRWVFLFFLYFSVLLSRAPASSGIWHFVFMESVFSKPLSPSCSNTLLSRTCP